MKTDVSRYDESIDHTLLHKQLDEDIAHPLIWRLLVQFVKRTIERSVRLSLLPAEYHETAR
jgi:RNA-directed DNA polymerase